MELLFTDDVRDGRHRRIVPPSQGTKLVLKMAEDHALNGNRRRSDGARAAKAGEQAKQVSAYATQPITFAPRTITALKLGGERGAVPLLVRSEFLKTRNQRGGSKPRKYQLPGVDVGGTMLASMIDLDDAIADVSGRQRLRYRRHEACCRNELPLRTTRVKFSPQ